MNLNEAKKAIKKCSKVFGYVKFTEDHGSYVRLVKADVLFMLEEVAETDEINMTVEKDGVFIN